MRHTNDELSPNVPRAISPSRKATERAPGETLSTRALFLRLWATARLDDPRRRCAGKLETQRCKRLQGSCKYNGQGGVRTRCVSSKPLRLTRARLISARSLFGNVGQGSLSHTRRCTGSFLSSISRKLNISSPCPSGERPSLETALPLQHTKYIGRYLL